MLKPHVEASNSRELLNIGIDGCKRGWIGVFRNQSAGVLQAVLMDHIDQLDHSIFGCIAIDIPIGLPELGSRECDKKARQLLSHRGCCVFPAPLRSLLDAPTYSDACDRRYAAEGKRISKQAWSIFKKISEVDEFLRWNQHLLDKVYEVHPEVSFCKMNNCTPLETRKSRTAGKKEREKLVDSHFGAGAYACLRNSILPKDGWADDDLLDACATLWTAERIAKGVMQVLPDASQVDTVGLPMRIVY